MSTRLSRSRRWPVQRILFAVFAFAAITLGHAAPAAAQCEGPASVSTDQAVYTTATGAVISGCGYSHKEPLNILVTGQDGRPRAVDGKGAPGPLAWSADDDGTFTIVHPFRPAPRYWRLAARDFGRFSVQVTNAAGVVLAETSFVRLPPRYATCATDPEGGPACWGNSTSDPDFFWLPPTVPVAAEATGPFDAAALADLEVDVCELDAQGSCVSGPPVAHFTSDGFPIIGRIRLLDAQEAYAATWITALSRTRPGTTVRVIVRHRDEVAGTIDLAIVRRPADLAAIDATRYIGVVFGSIVPLRFRIQQPTARTRVTINEVESSGGVPGDWIEFYNSAPVPVSLAGYRVLDNDDTHVYTVPDGTTVPARGVVVIEEAALDFGLGGADSVRLTTPEGQVLVDAYTWTSHAVTTYGRCPDGSGDFRVNTSVTKGAPNDCSLVVRINEVQTNGGAEGNWVELFNAGPAPADITGYWISDNDDAHRFVLLPVLVPAGGYLRFDESALGFTLDGADAVRLFRPDGTQADTFIWTSPAATTWGRCPNGSGPFSPTLGGTPGTANACFAPVTTLHINEMESSNGVPGDWIELVNTGTAAVDLSGWRLLDNDDTHLPYVFPDGTSIAPGSFLVVDEAAFDWGLGAAETVRLFDPVGGLYESYAWTVHAPTTYGRCPDGTGAFQTTTTVTRGTANDCSVVIRINEIESSGGVPGDWVELFNPGPLRADLGGFVFRDSDDTHAYAIPAGTFIEAGGYFVLEEAAFGFGLGAADSARLFTPLGAPADSHAWTAHATQTLGRCPTGTGAFVDTTASSKGTPNVCGVVVTTLHINEVESNGGTPGDWFELVNVGALAVDLAGWSMLDNDDTHQRYVFPAGSTIAPGGYLVVDEAQFGFGLGSADSVRIFDAGGTLYESYAWSGHATTTYGRCPDALGPFVTSTTSTKGAPNDCGSPIRINEVESDGGVPGDWVELVNPTSSTVDVSGLIVRDNDDTHAYTIPAGTSLTAGGYLVIGDAALGFGLGSADSVRLFDAGGVLIDATSWTAHAATSWGRCPNGTGVFVQTTAVTQGAVNACPGDASPWPGDPAVQAVDGLNVFGGNLSGLVYEPSATAPGVLWAVRNGPGSLFRLVWDGVLWTPDAANNWILGKALAYPDGTGNPDAEGVTLADGGAIVYVSTERDNNASAVSRNSILRLDSSGSSTALVATHEWNVTADLPAVGPNLGMEAITWVPDAFLVAQGFVDEALGGAYNPANYPDHGTGLFFVGLEANGTIYAYALNHANGSFARVATVASGMTGVMDLRFDPDTGDLWAVCDDTCGGVSTLLRVDPTSHRFTPSQSLARPSGMPNLNNEGFALAPLSECVAGQRAVFWSDDSETDGHAIRSGLLSCPALP
ncbi:MAG: lamin tail domain-containing protein [Vicinamibacterales bacterium]